MSEDRTVEDQETQRLSKEERRQRSPIGSSSRLGPYRLIQRIGQGGMGEVWEAEQSEPVKRRVAIKLIRAGLDSKEMVARFEGERQALAMMSHPAIAKVFDGGTTEDGVAYLVMELVDGIPLNKFCAQHKLDTEARLRLFVEICHGVQHAHQKAVIHRDLKPSNILVSMVDGKPCAKVIDFGVARTTSQPLTDRTLFTRLGQMVGTPQYMSPEQASQSAEGVDTRSDVYSLGVILYELLCGVRPFDLKDLKSSEIEAIRRKINEFEPTKPSTRVRQLSEDTTVSVTADSGTLSSRLRGDLDWITMKALEKERERRYSSPLDLAEDVGRHLENQPVLAGPPSGIYRMQKFVRRHRVGATAAALVTLALLVGFAGTVFGLVRAQRAEQAALREATTAKRVTDFMVDLFEQSDPDTARGEDISARAVLDRGVERIRADLGEETAVKASLMEAMGRVYTNLALYPEAEELLEGALKLRDASAAQGSRDASGEGKASGKTGGTFDGDGSIGDRVETAHQLAKLRTLRGNHAEAIAMLEEVLVQREAEFGVDHPKVADVLNTLGNALQEHGDMERSEAVRRRSLAIRESHPEVPEKAIAQSAHNLANALFIQGRTDEAEPLYRRSAAIEERLHGEDSYGLATTLHVLAMVNQDRGELTTAIADEERSLEIRERVLGKDHPHVALSLNTLGQLYSAVGRTEEAGPLHARAVTVARSAWGVGHGDARWIIRGYASYLQEQGRNDEAREELQALLTDTEAQVESAGLLVPTLNQLADLELASGNAASAKRALERVVEIEREVSGPNHPYVAEAQHRLANYHRDRGEEGLARGLYGQARTILEASEDPEVKPMLVALEEDAGRLGDG